MHNKAAFSLVELSIVLVILGLLVGGVLGGRNLIRAAELRNVTVELSQWQTAVNSFRQKYHALPGDMRNATRFWGAHQSACSASAPDTSPTQTCNGNGDGIISGWSRSSPTQCVFNGREQLPFWQHLSNAGLIPGNYVGWYLSANPTDRSAIVGQRVPASKAGSDLAWLVQSSICTPDENLGNSFILAKAPAGRYVYDYSESESLSISDVYSIDSKIDDGYPDKGSVRTIKTSFSNATYACQTNGDYQLDEPDRKCGMTFSAGF